MQALWMVLASFLFATMGVCVKLASGSFNAFELVLYRGLVGMVYQVGDSPGDQGCWEGGDF